MELEATFGTIDERPSTTSGTVSYLGSAIAPPSTLGYYYAHDSHPPPVWNSYACNQVPHTIIDDAPCGTYATSPSHASHPTVISPVYPQGEQHYPAALQQPTFAARPDQRGAIRGDGYDATGQYNETTITSTSTPTWLPSPTSLEFQQLQLHSWHDCPQPYVSHPPISLGLDTSSPIFGPYTSSSDQSRLPPSYENGGLQNAHSPPRRKGGRPRLSVETTVTSSGTKHLKQPNHTNGGTQGLPTATQTIRPSTSVARASSPRTESTQSTRPPARQRIRNTLRRQITPISNVPPPTVPASNADLESDYEDDDETTYHLNRTAHAHNDHIYPNDLEDDSDSDSAPDPLNSKSSLFATSPGVPTSSSSQATKNRPTPTPITNYTPYNGKSTETSTSADQRERKRLAAYRCRLKTREAAKRLEREEQAAAEHRSQLEACVAQLREEVYDLRSTLLLHADCDCALIRQYLGNAARLAVLHSGGGEVVGEVIGEEGTGS